MNSLFSASLKGKTLTIYQQEGSQRLPVTIIDKCKNHRFYLKDKGVVNDCYGFGREALIYQGNSDEEAKRVMLAIDDAFSSRNTKRIQFKRYAGVAATAIAITLALVSFSQHFPPAIGAAVLQEVRNTAESQAIPDQPAGMSQNNVNAYRQQSVVMPATTAKEIQPPPQLKAAPASEDYQTTAQTLKAAAQSGRYTISLSGGHARTLYVFADPLCHNCQIIEPALEALSQKYNVEIFPVTLVGKQQTVSLVSPIMCQASATRLPLWKNLFRADAGLAPGETNFDQSSCESGDDAIAKNDVAFNAYNLPGTPSLLSDDGRYIPLATLKTDESLAAFLNAVPLN